MASKILEESVKVPRTKNWAWYISPVGERLTPVARQLFEEYSGVPAEEVEEHVSKNRDLAWEVFPFPCIGEFWFLSFGLSQHPYYAPLLNDLRSNPSRKLLDLGCCFGQDLRKLAFDGAPISALYGSDLFAGYERSGHLLFLDEDRFKDRFITADIFEESAGGALVQTEGTWDVISIFMFLHVFNLEDAIRGCKRVIKLLKPEKGSYVIGTQTGALVAREFPMMPPFVEKVGDKSIFRHSKETFVEMWEKVENEVGVDLDIWAEYQEQEHSAGHGGKTYFGGNNNRRIQFRITKK